METWIIILVVVIGIIVRVLSSMAKKKAKQQQDERNAGGEGRAAPAPPPRPSSMSDIQRAFMEMSGLMEEPPKEPPVKAYSGSAGKTVPMNSTESRTVRSESLGSYEGAYSTEGQNGTTEGLGSYEGAYSTQGRSGTSEGLGSYEGAYSTEGKAGKTEGIEFHTAGSHSIGNKFADVDLTTLKPDLEEDLKSSYASITVVKQRKNPLKLFENKNDFTKAVIYSEILNRRTR